MKGGKKSVRLQLRRGVRLQEKQLCRPQGQCRRRGMRCSRCWSRDSPAVHGADHGEAVCPLQPVEVFGAADLHLKSGKDPMLEWGDA